MKKELIEFTIDYKASNMEALKKIEKNTKGFLVVLDNQGKVIGTLTDGDLRRAFISGRKMHETIEGEYKKTYKSVTIDGEIDSVIQMFKSKEINFIPILDKNDHLMSLITKKQMHSLMLQDVSVDLCFDFMALDEGLIDYEIYLKPWGFYKTTVMNSYFQSKIISVKPGGTLSLQSHSHREEHWIIAHGTGEAQICESIIDIRCGSSIYIPKGSKHRVTNTNKKENLIITEVQIGDYFGEEDIIRYDDIYGRL